MESAFIFISIRGFENTSLISPSENTSAPKTDIFESVSFILCPSSVYVPLLNLMFLEACVFKGLKIPFSVIPDKSLSTKFAGMEPVILTFESNAKSTSPRGVLFTKNLSLLSLKQFCSFIISRISEKRMPESAESIFNFNFVSLFIRFFESGVIVPFNVIFELLNIVLKSSM